MILFKANTQYKTKKEKKEKKRLKRSQKICSFVSTHSAQYRRQENDKIAMALFNRNKHTLPKSLKNDEYKENRNNDTMNK